MSRGDTTTYFAAYGKRVASLGRSIDAWFEAEGCTSYVKTIYIGYEIGGEMVAALYAHADRVELALALDEGDPHPRLKDASHLTWRTLPLAVDVGSDDEALEVKELALRACERVRRGIHSVHRDNEHFVRARRERRDTGPEAGAPGEG